MLRRTAPLRRAALPALALVLALALPHGAIADDDDSDDSSSSSSSSGPGQGGGATGDGRVGGLDLGPRPGSGDFMADVRGVVGLIFGTTARPPAPPPAGGNGGAELVATGLTPAGRTAALAAGFTILAERESTLAAARVTRLRAPAGLSTTAAAARLRALSPGANVAANSLYRPSALPCPASGCAYRTQVSWPATPRCGAGVAIGMVDTRVDAAHPALNGARVRRETVRGPGRTPSSTAHGTALAVLLVGAGEGPGQGLLPAARLVAVDPFHRRQDGDAADVFDLVAAIDLLAASDVAVANLSLAGPANPVLDAVGAAAAARGLVLVAAVGNAGPRSPPLYPAAYPWAVAVTAVDAKGEVFARAVRGRHVAFSAPGVSLPVVARGGAAVLRSGTSYAAPFVTAALALGHTREAERGESLRQLAALAEDLGPEGPDTIYGWGLVKPGGGC
jgi:hypothetical protein